MMLTRVVEMKVPAAIEKKERWKGIENDKVSGSPGGGDHGGDGGTGGILFSTRWGNVHQ